MCFFFRADISGAATISECLLLLSKNPEWKATVTMTIGNSVSSSLEDLDLSMIFGLLVFAGFPKVTTPTVMCSDHTHSSVVLTTPTSNTVANL